MAKLDVPRNSTSQKRRHLIANIKDKEDAVVFAEVFGELTLENDILAMLGLENEYLLLAERHALDGYLKSVSVEEDRYVVLPRGTRTPLCTTARESSGLATVRGGDNQILGLLCLSILLGL